MIRLPDIPNFAGNAIGMPVVNPAAAAAPAQALTGVAREIAAASSAFHDTAIQIQRQDNARLLSENRQSLAADMAKLDAELADNPDGAQRMSKTREFLAERKQAIQGLDLPPAVRDELLNHYGLVADDFYNDQTAKTARMEDRRSRQALANEYKNSVATGNVRVFEQAVATGREAGILLPEEEDALRGDFQRETTGNTLDLAIHEEPSLVLEDLDRPDFLTRFPGMSAADIPRLRSAARASEQRHRGEQLDLIEAALAVNKLQPEDIEAAGYLTPGDRAKVTQALAAVQSAKPPTDEEHAKAWERLISLREDFKNPAVSDREYAGRWNTARAEVLSLVATVPSAYRGDISSELSQQSPANREGGQVTRRSYPNKGEIRAIGFERIIRARNAGMYGSIAEDADPAKREEAYRQSEKHRFRVAEWIEQHPDAGIEEVTVFTDGLISGDRVKRTATDLQSFVPGGGQRFRPSAPAPVLPPKAGYLDRAAEDPLQIPASSGSASDALLPARQQLESFLAD